MDVALLLDITCHNLGTKMYFSNKYHLENIYWIDTLIFVAHREIRLILSVEWKTNEHAHICLCICICIYIWVYIVYI